MPGRLWLLIMPTTVLIALQMSPIRSGNRSVTTGLDYAVNRHYDPQQGRFTQVDLIGMSSVSLATPQTLNLYAYCINDPINHTDPSGLGFISFLKKLLNRIVNALIHAAITAAFTFLQTLIMTGGNFGAAVVAGAVAGGADFLKQIGWPSKGYWISLGGTPQWNPNAVAILSGGPSGLSRYIIYNLTNPQNLAPTVRDMDQTCRDQVFGKDATSYAGKDIPGQHQTGLMFLAGRANPNDSAMIAALWANESNFAETPGGDAGPAQLTSWWKNNQPDLEQGNAYGRWKGRTDKPFDGNVQDNVETLGEDPLHLSRRPSFLA